MSRLAIFTLVRNEAVYFPVWLNHYENHFHARDIYVLDHGSTGEHRDQLLWLQASRGFHLLSVGHPYAYDSIWMSHITRAFQDFLLQAGYDVVLFAAADEILVCAPNSGLSFCDLPQVMEKQGVRALRCNAFEVVHKTEEEPALDVTRPWLAQRSHWYHTERYSKPLVADMRLDWKPGWFGAYNVPQARSITQSVLLIHLHKIDNTIMRAKHRLTATQRWCPDERNNGPLRHNLLEDPDQLALWQQSTADNSGEYAVLSPIPEAIKKAVHLCDL